MKKSTESLTDGQRSLILRSMAESLVDSLSWPGTYDLSSMNLKPIIACASVAACLWGAGDFPSPPPASASGLFCANPGYVSPEKRLRPLMDLIAKGEGDYNSSTVATGDTPGGIQGITGQTFENYTVGQVIDMQRSTCSPSALPVHSKHPALVRQPLQRRQAGHVHSRGAGSPHGHPGHLQAPRCWRLPARRPQPWALNELAKEWASIEYRYGRSYYSVEATELRSRGKCPPCYKRLRVLGKLRHLSHDDHVP